MAQNYDWLKAPGEALFTKKEVGDDLLARVSAIETSPAQTNSGYQKPASGIPATDLESSIQDELNLANTSYQKPSSGIPDSDLTVEVQDKLFAAINAYALPSTGIPEGDLAASIRTRLQSIDSKLSVETDPTVPAWAKTLNKPSYTNSEVGALADTTLYAASNEVGGAATEASKLTNPIIIRGNGNDLLSFDGTTSESVNITAEIIGAATQLQGEMIDNWNDILTSNDTVNKANEAYVKPSTGVSLTDLDQSIQDTLNNSISSGAIDAKFNNYSTTAEVDQKITESKTGTFVNAGFVSSRTDLPSSCADFQVYRIIDEGVNVFAYNGSGSITWLEFAPNVDLSLYAKLTDLNSKMVDAVTLSDNHTDTKLLGKLDATAQASDSKLLNGKPDTSFATAAQGAKADTAYQKPSIGMPITDMDAWANNLLNKANSALQTETDPTVPAWAKTANKPVYTYDEVGALPTNTKYALAGSVGGSALTANKLANTLTIKENNVVLGEFNGSNAVTVNITADKLGLGTMAMENAADYVKSTGTTSPLVVAQQAIATMQTQQAANTAAISTLAMNSSQGSWGEIDTGRQFRGKKIYRQDFTLYLNASANVVADFTLISTANYVDDIISVGGWWSIGYQTERWCLPSAGDGTNYAYVLLYGNNNQLVFRSKANNARSSAQAIIIVEYTKK